MKAKLPRMVTQEHLEERIIYFDMLALLVLHNEFGFGPQRLRKYYEAIGKWDERYAVYNTKNDPDWGKKDKDGRSKLCLWAMQRDLYNIGFDYQAIVNDMEDEKK